jgi:hypothetical protein
MPTVLDPCVLTKADPVHTIPQKDRRRRFRHVARRSYCLNQGWGRGTQDWSSCAG